MKKVTIKALSVRQPYAYWIAHRLKTIEFRSWKSQYRGPLLIVASKKPMDRDDAELHRELKIKIDYGMAICVVDLVDCRPMERKDARNSYHDNFDRATYSWVLKKPRIIKSPFPVKGKLRLYDVKLPGAVAARLRIRRS